MWDKLSKSYVTVQSTKNRMRWANLFAENDTGVPEPKTVEGCSLDEVLFFLVGK